MSTALLNMAASLRRALGQRRIAWRTCLRSLEMDEDPVTNRAAWTCKGALLRDAGALGEAVAVLETLHEITPKDVYVLRALVPACAGLAEVQDDAEARDRALLYATRLAELCESRPDPLAELRELKDQTSNEVEARGIARLIDWLLALHTSSPN